MRNLDQGLTQVHVAIIGGGYAGLAAAVELAARGVPVRVFEAARTLGGRARGLTKDGHDLDNGQHILIGAYRETLRLIELVGVDTGRSLLRLPLSLAYADGTTLRAARLPAPWHLLLALAGARGLALRDRLSAVRFISRLRRRSFRLDFDASVETLLDQHRQPTRLRRYLWEPLCIAALNTPLAQASAQVFTNVLRDSLAADAGASDLLLPRCNLSRLFPEVASAFILARGGNVTTGTSIQAVRALSGDYVLDGDTEGLRYTHVMAAVAPFQIEGLTAGLPELEAQRRALAGFSYQPIVTCYLAYDTAVKLPAPMIGMVGGITQWLFDRGALSGQAGLLAAVISARGTHSNMNREDIANRVHEEICVAFGSRPPPRWIQVITEKRATFSCVPGLRRPHSETALPNFYLCGDYVASDYPATLEAAVRSGVRCAHLVLASRGL